MITIKRKKSHTGISIAQRELQKITGNSSLRHHNIQFAFRFIRHLHFKKGFSSKEIADKFEVDENLINNIILSSKGKQKITNKMRDKSAQNNLNIFNDSLAVSLQEYIGKTTLGKLLRNHNRSAQEIRPFLRRIYRLWHKFGTFQALSQYLNISPSKTSALINFIRENKVIRYFKISSKNLTEEQEQKILETKRLYDELGTLAAVGVKLGLTRERVRQLLAKGDNYGIIEYKTSYLKKFDGIATKINKKDLEKLYIEYGSTKEVKNFIKDKFNIELSNEHIKHLLNLYKIDLDYLNDQHRRHRCFTEYNTMVQEIGFHPATTIMSKRNNWRALWSRITRLWGSMDNFRRAFGIPIPQKGNPRFLEDIQEAKELFLEEKRKIRSEKLKRILEYINNNSPASRSQIQKFIGLSYMGTVRHLEELIKKDKIDWMRYEKKYLYFRKI